MIAKALYFPYIRTPKEEWFIRVLLYWDAVGTIVPGGLEKDPRYVTPRMRELREEGLLEVVHPLMELRNLPKFRREFLDGLDADKTVQERRARPLDELLMIKVHVWKLRDLADDLIDLGLARKSTGVGWELWLEVEERTADLFMAYLATALGLLQKTPMHPVTDREQAMAALVGGDTRAGLTLKQARERRVGVLEDLLPAPETPIPAKELARFKRVNEDELGAFRDRVDEELLKVAALPEVDAQEAQAEIAQRRLRRERDQIVELMERRRWPHIAFGAIAGLAAPVALTASGALDPVFLAPSLVPAVHAALQGARRPPEVRTSPMAYAALAQGRFGS